VFIFRVNFKAALEENFRSGQGIVETARVFIEEARLVRPAASVIVWWRWTCVEALNRKIDRAGLFPLNRHFFKVLKQMPILG